MIQYYSSIQYHPSHNQYFHEFKNLCFIVVINWWFRSEGARQTNNLQDVERMFSPIQRQCCLISQKKKKKDRALDFNSVSYESSMAISKLFPRLDARGERWSKFFRKTCRCDRSRRCGAVCRGFVERLSIENLDRT